MYRCESWTIKNAEKSERVSCSVMSDSATPAGQAPLSMEFSRQEHWSELPFPSPEDLPNLGIKPRSPALQANSLLSEPPGKSPQKAEPQELMLSNCGAGEDS